MTLWLGRCEHTSIQVQKVNLAILWRNPIDESFDTFRRNLVHGIERPVNPKSRPFHQMKCGQMQNGIAVYVRATWPMKEAKHRAGMGDM